MFELLSTPIKEVLGALLRRVGTAFSAFLVAHEVPMELIGQLMVAVGVVLGLGFDVLLAMFYRRRLRQAVKAMVEATPPAPDYGTYELQAQRRPVHQAQEGQPI